MCKALSTSLSIAKGVVKLFNLSNIGIRNIHLKTAFFRHRFRSNKLSIRSNFTKFTNETLSTFPKILFCQSHSACRRVHGGNGFQPLVPRVLGNIQISVDLPIRKPIYVVGIGGLTYCIFVTASDVTNSALVCSTNRGKLASCSIK